MRYIEYVLLMSVGIMLAVGFMEYLSGCGESFTTITGKRYYYPCVIVARATEP